MIPDDALLFDLSNRGKVELFGPESLIFLHNLCTNDVKNMPVGAGCEAFLTTAKAKVVAHILIGHFLQPDGKKTVLLDFVPGMSDKVMQHLNRYIISEQVELADRTNEIALLRLTGPKPAGVLEKLGQTPGDLPHLHHRNLEIAGVPVHLRRHELLRMSSFDVFCSAEKATLVRDALSAAGALPAGLDIHEVLRVEAGLPEFGIDIDENRAVMEVGRVKEAICYTKGCFLGQEPIVMARDRGHVNRTLLGLQVSGGEPLKSGVRVFRDQEEAGQVTSSVWSPRLQNVIALAYLKRGHQEPGTKLVIEPESDGRVGEVTALPFIN